MKGIRRIIFIYIAFMGAVLVLLFVMRGRMNYKGRDIALYNDRLLSMQEEYLRGESVEKLEQKYDCRIILAKSLTDTELSGLYGRNAMVIDFVPGGEYLGKAAWEDSLEDYEKDRGSFFTAALVLWGVSLTGGLLLILLLYHHYQSD